MNDKKVNFTYFNSFCWKFQLAYGFYIIICVQPMPSKKVHYNMFLPTNWEIVKGEENNKKRSNITTKGVLVP
jgi:hypothetical protein